MDTTIMKVFRQVFDRDLVLDAARRVGALQRLRAVHPADFLLAVGSCALGDEERSIATARREFSRLSGFMPEESSFYERFSQGMANLSFHLFLCTLAQANRVQRQAIAKALGLPVRDVRVVDSTQVTLPKSAEPLFPSTNRGYGGIKLTATLSVLQDLICSAHITDARRHDAEARHDSVTALCNGNERARAPTHMATTSLVVSQIATSRVERQESYRHCKKNCQ